MIIFAVMLTRGMMQPKGPQLNTQAGLAAVVTIVGLLVFIGPFGIEAAAIITSLSQLVNMSYVMVRERRLRGVAPSTPAIASA